MISCGARSKCRLCGKWNDNKRHAASLSFLRSTKSTLTIIINQPNWPMIMQQIHNLISFATLYCGARSSSKQNHCFNGSHFFGNRTWSALSRNTKMKQFTPQASVSLTFQQITCLMWHAIRLNDWHWLAFSAFNFVVLFKNKTKRVQNDRCHSRTRSVYVKYVNISIEISKSLKLNTKSELT